MKPAVEVSITSWKKNVVKPGQEYGRVLLMPGTGYNCDRPLLYWSAQALVEAGWRIDRMNVRNASDDLSTVSPVLNQAIDGWVAAARECISEVWFAKPAQVERYKPVKGRRRSLREIILLCLCAGLFCCPAESSELQVNGRLRKERHEEARKGSGSRSAYGRIP